MKKLGKIVAIVMATAAVTAAAAGFAACGGESAGEIQKTYIVSETTDGATAGTNYCVYQLHLLDNSRYELVKTTYTYGYNMNLGTYSVETFGTYTAGSSVDGYTPYTLSRSDRAIVNAYSLAGGFNIYIDTATATYPTELPAVSQGEKNMAQSADDVFDAYGAQITVYVSDANNTFSLTNPNA